MKRAYIKYLANYVPEQILTNKDFEKILDTNDEWIVTRTGMKTRHIAEHETTLDMALSVVNNIKAKGANLNEVDSIIVPTTTKEYLFPSTAGLIQKHLGLKHCFAFDSAAACSGYIYSLNTATALIESGECKNVLIVASEKLTKDINWKDRGTAILFGDAAHALLVSATEDENKGVIAMDMKSDAHPEIIALNGGSAKPIEADLCDEAEFKIFMNGSETFKIAVTEFGNSIETVLKKASLSLSDVNFFVPHQANLRIIQSVAKRTGISLDKVGLILDKYGNTSSTSIGLGLCESVEKGRIKEGDLVLLTAFGGGFTWGSTLMRW